MRRPADGRVDLELRLPAILDDVHRAAAGQRVQQLLPDLVGAGCVPEPVDRDRQVLLDELREVHQLAQAPADQRQVRSEAGERLHRLSPVGDALQARLDGVGVVLKQRIGGQQHAPLQLLDDGPDRGGHRLIRIELRLFAGALHCRSPSHTLLFDGNTH